MALTNIIRTLVLVSMLCVPATAVMAQAQQPSPQRDDPASVGTGPSSRSLGQIELRSAEGPCHDERQRRDDAIRHVEAGWQHQGKRCRLRKA
jgi:hypothetical protein